MPFNGSGIFLRVRNWVNDAASGIKILADRHDSEDDNFADGLTNCITKDGQTTITANLPMAGFKHTGVGSATTGTQYARADQVQSGSINWGVSGGTADAITVTYGITLSSLSDGQICYFRATGANTVTNPTFSPDGNTARTIVKNGGSALVAGDIAGAGYECIVRYNLANTRWELLNPATAVVPDSSISTAKIADSAVTTAKINDAAVTTAKINDSAVTTAKINDDAVTLAKMASGTAGNLITYDASGNPAAVATGTSGQVLTSNGAGAAPTFQTISLPYTDIGDTTVGSAVASVTHSFTADTYLALEVYITNISSAGTNAALTVSLADSGGNILSVASGTLTNTNSYCARFEFLLMTEGTTKQFIGNAVVLGNTLNSATQVQNGSTSANSPDRVIVTWSGGINIDAGARIVTKARNF